MRHPDHVWLADILIAARHVRRFVEGVSREELEVDEMRISAVIQKLEIMGEAAKNVSPEFKSGHSTIPWKAMAGCGTFSSTRIVRSTRICCGKQCRSPYRT